MAVPVPYQRSGFVAAEVVVDEIEPPRNGVRARLDRSGDDRPPAGHRGVEGPPLVVGGDRGARARVNQLRGDEGESEKRDPRKLHPKMPETAPSPMRGPVTPFHVL